MRRFSKPCVTERSRQVVGAAEVVECWIVSGVGCCLAMLTVFGMCWVHADWSTGNRLGHFALAVALGGGGGADGAKQ